MVMTNVNYLTILDKSLGVGRIVSFACEGSQLNLSNMKQRFLSDSCLTCCSVSCTGAHLYESNGDKVVRNLMNNSSDLSLIIWHFQSSSRECDEEHTEVVLQSIWRQTCSVTESLERWLVSCFQSVFCWTVVVSSSISSQSPTFSH